MTRKKVFEAINKERAIQDKGSAPNDVKTILTRIIGHAHNAKKMATDEGVMYHIKVIAALAVEAGELYGMDE